MVVPQAENGQRAPGADRKDERLLDRLSGAKHQEQFTGLVLTLRPSNKRLGRFTDVPFVIPEIRLCMAFIHNGRVATTKHKRQGALSAAHSKAIQKSCKKSRHINVATFQL